MPKVDRRITKSQEAIKKAFIELMCEKNFDNITIQNVADRANVNRGTVYLHYLDKFDLLGKLIEEHINKLRELCDSASEMDLDFIDSTVMWYEYFENNYLFFSTMLASSGAPHFRIQFLNLLVEELKGEVDVTKGKNQGLNEDIIIQFIATSYVGLVEWWFSNEMPFTPRVMAKEIGDLIERIV
jgi:AcrR family transcriptional regulator